MTAATHLIPTPATGRPLVGPPALASVLGAGISGLAVAGLLLDKGYSVYLSDIRRDHETENACRALAQRKGVRISLGAHDPDTIAGSGFIVPSPGISEDIAPVREAAARGIPVFSEVELAYWFCPVPMAAVTGTNGKSTTVSLLGRMLESSGIRTRVAGNIGHALCRAVSELTDESILVAEISSFQLHTIKSFRPRLAMLLNLSPDHLERYGEIEDYYTAKLRIFENMDCGDLAVLNADDPETAARADRVGKTAPAWFGLSESAEHLSFVRDGSLWVRRGRSGSTERILALEKFPLPGLHNIQNLMAAAAAAVSLGAEARAVAEAAVSFTGLPHRLETVARIDGVTYINDSKATTVYSVIRALESLSGPAVLIMGGRHKGYSFKPLAQNLAHRVRRLVVIGEAAETISTDLGKLCSVTRAGDLEQALAMARALAHPGDSVILSPGCSSFDMFTDFEQRGNTFKEIVQRMKANGS